LKRYLEALSVKFRDEPDSSEIISDIESRMAELLGARLGTKRQVVSMIDIDFLMETLGDPEIISDEEPVGNHKKSHTYQRRYRRMYRDPDDRVLGGVCAGLGAYWDMDPVILRVIFIVLVLLGGSGVLIYLILWIILPEAQTAAQKLEMRGENVTIDSIKDFIKSEFDQVKENFKKK
jgi:phage shock protein PspC (stress-responsive transcriptional regulator)